MSSESTVHDLLRELEACGATLKLDGDRLRVTSPTALAKHVSMGLQQHKATLVEMIKSGTIDMPCEPVVDAPHAPNTPQPPRTVRTARDIVAELPHEPCHGQCGQLTPYGWYCLACRVHQDGGRL